MKYFSFDKLNEMVYYMHKMEEMLVFFAIVGVIYMLVSLFLIYDKQ